MLNTHPCARCLSILLGLWAGAVGLCATPGDDATMRDEFDDSLVFRNPGGPGDGFTDGSSRNATVRESDGALALHAQPRGGHSRFGAAYAISKNRFLYSDGAGAVFHFTLRRLPACRIETAKRIRGLVLGVVSARDFEIGTDCPGLGLDFPALDKIASPSILVALLDEDEDGKVEGAISLEYAGHFTNLGQHGRVARFEFDQWDGLSSMTASLHLNAHGYRFAFSEPVSFTSGSTAGRYPSDFPPMGESHVFAGYKSSGGDAYIERISAEGGAVHAPAPLQVFLDDDFSSGAVGSLPSEWSALDRKQGNGPAFELVEMPGATGGKALMARGNGRPDCHGYVQRKVHLSGGTYRYRVRFKIDGIEDVNRCLMHGLFGDFNHGIFEYRKEPDGWIVGENRIIGRPGGDSMVRLTFRFSAEGTVWWDHVLLEQIDPIPPRLVKIAVSSGDHGMEDWAQWLDLAGRRGVDVALLPEAFNHKPPEPLEGPTARFLSQKAKQWNRYVSGTFDEKRGERTYNTAALYDRDGRPVGTYEKVELYDPEIDGGCSPGNNLAVYRTDFGKVGTMICYDSWHPEICRILAYKGAELILFPNAGYYESLMPARAADNGVWIAVSTCGPHLGVWDSGGIQAGAGAWDPSQGCQTSVYDYLDDPEHHMFVATVDLNMRLSPHNWGGPLGSAPGGRRVRQTTRDNVEKELLLEARRWWVEP